MKHLVKHLFENNLNEILSKSLLNCHVKGLHSIMLSDCAGKTIRLYVAMEGNELYKNHPNHMKTKAMSVAFHPHHCNLTLHCIKGVLYNQHVTTDSTNWTVQMELYKFLYQSKINAGEMAFKPLGKEYLYPVKDTYLKEGECLSMKASDIHTVACGNGELTAWLVYEGKEDKDYIPYCWSNDEDLNNRNSEGLYLKPTKEDIENLLQKLDLL